MLSYNLKVFLMLEFFSLNQTMMVWLQLMEMHIAEREKLSNICGKTKSPAESEDGYEK